MSSKITSAVINRGRQIATLQRQQRKRRRAEELRWEEELLNLEEDIAVKEGDVTDTLTLREKAALKASRLAVSTKARPFMCCRTWGMLGFSLVIVALLFFIIMILVRRK